MSLFLKVNGAWKKIISSESTIIQATINKVYPVGAIYMSMSSVSPATLFGGQWQALNEGRVLIGANSTYTAGSKGGSKDAVVVSHNHTFTGTQNTTGNQNQHHGHTLGEMDFTGSFDGNVDDGASLKTGVFYDTGTRVSGSNGAETGGIIGFKASEGYNKKPTANENANHNHTYTPAGTISTNGVNGTDRNMQPYLAVYMWRRTG